jgi:hypothetical protein
MADPHEPPLRIRMHDPLNKASYDSYDCLEFCHEFHADAPSYDLERKQPQSKDAKWVTSSSIYKPAYLYVSRPI